MLVVINKKSIYDLVQKEWKKSGYSVENFISIYKTADQLRTAGFSLSDLKPYFDASTLKEAGFSASEFFQANYKASELKAAGFSAYVLKTVGFNASQIKDAGYRLIEFIGTTILTELRIDDTTVKGLKDAGFSASEINEYSSKFPRQDFIDAGFTESELQNFIFFS